MPLHIYCRQDVKTYLNCLADSLIDVTWATAGELLVKVENQAPVQDSFRFEYIADKLQAAADYLLQYSLHPAVPGAPIIMAGSRLTVLPGQPSKFALEVPYLFSKSPGRATCCCAFGNNDSAWKLLLWPLQAKSVECGPIHNFLFAVGCPDPAQILHWIPITYSVASSTASRAQLEYMSQRVPVRSRL